MSLRRGPIRVHMFVWRCHIQIAENRWKSRRLWRPRGTTAVVLFICRTSLSRSYESSIPSLYFSDKTLFFCSVGLRYHGAHYNRYGVSHTRFPVSQWTQPLFSRSANLKKVIKYINNIHYIKTAANFKKVIIITVLYYFFKFALRDRKSRELNLVLECTVLVVYMYMYTQLY